jgi:serine protease Do
LIFSLIFWTFELDAESVNGHIVPLEYQDSIRLTNQNNGRSLTSLFNDVNQSIVQISEAQPTSPASKQGSGFIYDNHGHVVTNYHVIADLKKIPRSAKDFHITFVDGRTYIGRVVGADPYSDLAVMMLENMSGKHLVPLPMGNSSKLRIGQPVLALGNPFGLSGSMTVGIVSGFGRLLPSSAATFYQQDTPLFLIPNLIQTDAIINPGNSGGPLLNLAGEVVGINIGISSNTEVNAGVGSAIPSNIIKRVVPELISTGRYKQPYIGIAGVDVSPEIAREMGLSDSRGFLVTEVISGSAAERSGIRGGGVLKNIDGKQTELGGDVITAVDNVTVRKIVDLLSYLQSERSVGDTVILSVLREGKIIKIGMTVDVRPPV